MREAQARGVDPARMVFAPFTTRSEHIRRHRAADLFLDTLLYYAAATASASLPAGVSVLACLGTTFASRVATSLLRPVGLPELIAHDIKDYEHTAVKLARNPSMLGWLKDHLAALFADSPLLDHGRFVRKLEPVYLRMWENDLAHRPPEPIEVSE